jgi:hypothetical protein
VFHAIFAEFCQPRTSFSLNHRSVEGEFGYLLWRAETADNVYEMGTDTFVVRNDQILLQSFALTVRPKR